MTQRLTGLAPFILADFEIFFCVGICSLYFLFAGHVASQYASKYALDEIAWIKTRQSSALRSTPSSSRHVRKHEPLIVLMKSNSCDLIAFSAIVGRYVDGSRSSK